MTRLDQIRERLEKAARGPWRIADAPYTNRLFLRNKDDQTILALSGHHSDLEFISKLREDLVYLLKHTDKQEHKLRTLSVQNLKLVQEVARKSTLRRSPR